MTPPRDTRSAPATLREAFWYWFKFGVKVGTIKLIAACALVGLVLSYRYG